MQQWSASLGVQCTYCHADSNWQDTSNPLFDFARRMSRMVAALNAGTLAGVEGVTCWTCHRGQARPARLPRASWQDIQAAHSDDFATRPDRSLTMSVYSASLGVECSHCHDSGDWTAPTRPAHATTMRMLEMFEEIPKHFNSSRMPSTQCYMCHQGKRTPERRPPQ